jgi:hypothetical protein
LKIQRFALLKEVGVVVRFLFEDERKFDDEARAAERGIVDDDFSLVFANDFLRYREAEAGAAALVFRREGPEDRVAVCERDAGADVVDDNENALGVGVKTGANLDSTAREAGEIVRILRNA